MAVTINTNVSSLVAQNNLSKNTEAYQKAMEQISSGLRINRASDDAAGLSISESIKTQLNGNSKAISNIANGQNLLNVAEGGEITVTNHLQRIRELCVQAANETYTASDKNNILQEIKQRLKDINNISESTTFNGVKLLDGSKTSLSLQIGANSDEATNALDIGPALADVHISVLGNPVGNVDDPKGIIIPDSTTGETWSTSDIRDYMDRLDTAITSLSSKRALLGAYGNRLAATSSNLTVMNQNLSETNSRILDADIASTSSDLVKYQILQQTSASILTQANQLPSIALKLLQ
ncbi:MAG TPA: flagellin [Candidatus Gastranaerophilaceae bacterium]|nr:flagellin [Candidatus Gastranaerophilaceae bacterium]HPT41784.1 flagellin [Candidatus Gastranaerophilaceae bacterium]